LFLLAPLKNSTPLILACRVVLRTIFACAANDFTVSHETNSLPGNKMYVARLKKFSLQKDLLVQSERTQLQQFEMKK
jgi:hypothetical protein